jgi:hypothetical protein
MIDKIVMEMENTNRLILWCEDFDQDGEYYVFKNCYQWEDQALTQWGVMRVRSKDIVVLKAKENSFPPQFMYRENLALQRHFSQMRRDMERGQPQPPTTGNTDPHFDEGDFQVD